MKINISRRVLLVAIVAVLFVKVMVVFYISQYGLWSFGGRSDADYYHDYAIGDTQNLANHWGLLLRRLNEAGLYSRQVVGIFLMLLGFLVIPFMVAEIGVGHKGREPELYLAAVLLVSLYPTLFYYTLDIYRDAVLCFLFLLAVYTVGRIILVERVRDKVILFAAVILLSSVMFLLRPYLGVSVFAALLGCVVFDFARQRLWLCVAAYLVMVNMLYVVGGFDRILLYRSKFESALKGGSNLNIVFDSAHLFIPVFLENFFVQLAGLYFMTPIAAGVFFVESTPFILGVAYIFWNRRFADQLVSFLVVFSFFYGTVWLVGNDNVGTAIRLRMCNYLSVMICVLVIYINKKKNAAQVQDG